VVKKEGMRTTAYRRTLLPWSLDGSLEMSLDRSLGKASFFRKAKKVRTPGSLAKARFE
jgi:hypothetical protein